MRQQLLQAELCWQGFPRSVQTRPRLQLHHQRPPAAQCQLWPLRVEHSHPLLHPVPALPASPEQTLGIRGPDQGQECSHGSGYGSLQDTGGGHGGVGLSQVRNNTDLQDRTDFITHFTSGISGPTRESEGCTEVWDQTWSGWLRLELFTSGATPPPRRTSTTTYRGSTRTHHLFMSCLLPPQVRN